MDEEQGLPEAVAFALSALASLSPESLAQLENIYALEVSFEDPFQRVEGIEAVRAIYAHMFEALEHPQFEILECVRQDRVAYVRWLFHFARRGQSMAIKGVSRLQWDRHDGGTWRIISHRDDWDAAEQVYERVPILGWMIRAIKRRLVTPQIAR